MAKLGYWLQEIRAPFLTLSVALIFLGTSVALLEGSVFLWRAALALVGLILVHISVNVFNEYSDYQTGIDFNTDRTPFSGGSGMLTEGKISPGAAYTLGIVCLGIGAAIGFFFVWITNVWLVPILLVGGFAIYFYTTFLAKHAVGELFAGLGMGSLPILGASFVHTGHYSAAAVVSAVVAGILTFNLLLLNEFPDIDADTKGGRKNLLMAFGIEPAGKIYTLLLVAMYVWIVAAVLIGLIPVYGLIALLTLAIAWKPMKWAWNNVHDKESMIPALGANVMTNIITQFLLGAGFLASVYL